MMKWSILALIGLLGVTGCSGDGQNPSNESPQASEKSIAEPDAQASNEPVEAPTETDKKTVKPERTSRQGKVASRRDNGANALREKGAQGRTAPAKPGTRAATRVAPPKGMDAHPDFVGARVGLIQTANVMGEVDPCG